MADDGAQLAPEANADGAEISDPAAENPDDLLRRLEDEKQEWQRQLAAMKEIMEEQDRKMEEDRNKRKEYLEREEKKTQIVTAKAKPAAARILGTQAAKVASEYLQSIPAITTRTNSIWAGMSDFHNRRARNVAKAMPSMSQQMYESYLAQQQYKVSGGALQAGPARSSRQSVTQYTGGNQLYSQFGYPAAGNQQDQTKGACARFFGGGNAGPVQNEGYKLGTTVRTLTQGGNGGYATYSTASMQSGMSGGGSVVVSNPSSGGGSVLASNAVYGGGSGTVLASNASYGPVTRGTAAVAVGSGRLPAYTAAPPLQQASLLQSSLTPVSSTPQVLTTPANLTSWYDPLGLLTGPVEPAPMMTANAPRRQMTPMAMTTQVYP